jgi:hypothetical protein
MEALEWLSCDSRNALLHLQETKGLVGDVGSSLARELGRLAGCPDGVSGGSDLDRLRAVLGHMKESVVREQVSAP